MKKIVDMEKWNEFVSKSLEHPTNLEGFYKAGLENMAIAATKWLKSQPDAEEKHGKWKFAIGYDINKKVQCQNCLKMAYEPTSYCPNCGAKMYLGEEE